MAKRVRDRADYMRAYMRAKRARQRAERITDSVEAVLQQHEHVRAWVATLTPLERLEYRAWLRRCFLGKGTWSWRDGDPGSQAGLDKLEAAKQKKFTDKV